MSRFGKKGKFSQPRVNVTPDGDINGTNVDYTLPDNEKYIPGTLEVYLGGRKLCGDQANPDRDYNETVDMRGFKILIDAENPFKLNVPPCEGEGIELSYYKILDC